MENLPSDELGFANTQPLRQTAIPATHLQLPRKRLRSIPEIAKAIPAELELLSHAAGPASRIGAGDVLGRVSDGAIDLCKRFEAKIGQEAYWRNCGSIRLASSEGHRDWLLQACGRVFARGQGCHWIGPEEVRRLNPPCSATGVLGTIDTPMTAMWTPPAPARSSKRSASCSPMRGSSGR